jgi:nicotinamidase-related amidase
MQRLFGPGYPWAVPWLEKVVPVIETLCAHHAAQTIFTRFIPALRAGEGRGSWERYYRKWACVTLDEIGLDAIRLVASLERFVPPGKVLDKAVYSPWTEGHLDRLLTGTGINTIVISGGETDVCVLATVLGAIDRGYRVVLAIDALCSSSDETHDALMRLYLTRFSEQIEVSSSEEILENWR